MSDDRLDSYGGCFGRVGGIIGMLLGAIGLILATRALLRDRYRRLKDPE